MNYFNSDFKIDGKGRIEKLVNTANEIKKNISDQIKQPSSEKSENIVPEMQLRDINKRLTQSQSKLTNLQMQQGTIQEMRGKILQFPKKSADIILQEVTNVIEQMGVSIKEIISQIKKIDIKNFEERKSRLLEFLDDKDNDLKNEIQSTINEISKIEIEYQNIESIGGLVNVEDASEIMERLKQDIGSDDTENLNMNYSSVEDLIIS